MGAPLVDPARIHPLNDAAASNGPVVYWMSRDQRARDNWALLHAVDIARGKGESVAVVFTLARASKANARVYGFMLRGLELVERELRAKGIPLIVLVGDPASTLVAWARRHGIGTVVCDFAPLRAQRAWRKEAASQLDIPVIEVDAHNVVPCRFVSDKKEWAARTIRPKIHRHLRRFLTDYPRLPKTPRAFPSPAVDWHDVHAAVRIDASVHETDVRPGTDAALRTLAKFIGGGLRGYGEGSNDPNREHRSRLSPYLHFGHLSAQRAALTVRDAKAPAADREKWLEELVVRRELSDNFCLHEPKYDAIAGFPDWAKRTLDAHRDDPRERVYAHATFAQARTHDPLWNAAQNEMVRTGSMHGFMRMYWAKKILEWTRTPEQAMRVAIILNDRYELDGRDPNGYAGIAWSIGGVHDRSWGNRKVIGGIRPMTASGCARKFDVDAYIARWS